MAKKNNLLSLAAATLLGATLSGQVMAHGDVVPQAVETGSLTLLGEEWLDENPYRGNDNKDYEEAVRIGSSAYNQNCARCHGLEVISGDALEVDPLAHLTPPIAICANLPASWPGSGSVWKRPSPLSSRVGCSEARRA